MAQAEAAAERIAAESQIAIDRLKAEASLDLEIDLRLRATARSHSEQIRQQENMEAVVRLALPDLRADAEPEKIDDDWISHFFERSRNVTNEQMRILWARVLAGEANAPGSISKRTVDFLASMETKEGLDFSQLCNFGISTVDGLVPVITDVSHEIYTRSGIDFNVVAYLEKHRPHYIPYP